MSDFKTPLNVLEFPRLSLFEPVPGGTWQRSTFGWSLLNDNPQATTWTRIEGDKDKGRINAGIGYEALEGFVATCFEIIDNGGQPDAVSFDTLVPNQRDDGSNTRDRAVASTLTFGRNAEGFCYIGLKSADPDRPQIVFHYRGFEWHPMRQKSKTLTDQDMSTIQARAYFKHLEKAILYSVKGQTPEERKAAAEARKAKREGRKPTYSNQPAAAAAKPSYSPVGDFSEEEFTF